LTPNPTPPRPEQRPRSERRGCTGVLAGLLLLQCGLAWAGGGVVLSNDTCIIRIGFYEAHFTAYQPDARGDREFCEDLPDAGKTVFVLDYLHSSLKEVPVDFRIIRNVTGKGEFAREPDVIALPDLDAATVFYQSPLIKSNGTFLVEYRFESDGEYIGIVTAGHPSNANIYTSVFPFEVGASRVPWGWMGLGVALLLAAFLLVSMKRIGRSGVGPST
jgi:hypothetical protein